jgi:hypothetical protein
MRTTRTFAVARALVLIAFALPAGADPADSRSAVEPLLQSVERLPSRERLDQAAGGAADPALRQIVTDKRTSTRTRVEALSALCDYPGEATTVALRQVIVDRQGATAGGQVLELRAALLSYAKVSPSDAGALIIPLVASAVPDVRADAARAARLAVATDALPALRARLLVEDVGFVRLELLSAIGVLTH